jgi:hypothetical protein
MDTHCFYCKFKRLNFTVNFKSDYIVTNGTKVVANVSIYHITLKIKQLTLRIK